MKYKNGKVSPSVLEKATHGYQRSKLCNNAITARYRQRKLNNLDFTIISNNCWGGECYEYFGLIKASPTIGVYIFADDYIRFVSNLKDYLSKKIVFISYEKSKHKDILEERGHTSVPIGLLGDVEIVFLHYPDEKDAMEKWNRRVKRVNYDNLIVKFSNQNGASHEDIVKFSKLRGVKKVLFLSRYSDEFPEAIYYPEFSNAPELLNDTYIWNKRIDVFSLINREE